MRRAAGVVLVVGALVAACGTDDPSVVAEQRGRPVVVATTWVLAEAARELGDDEVVVINLTPVGESPHELDLTPRQRAELREADLAIVVGKGYQPNVERIARARRGPTVDLLDSLALPDRPDGAAGDADPHVWLDPSIMGSVVTVIAEALADVVPDAADAVRDRAQSLVEEYVDLDARFKQTLQACRRTVVAAQHDAFGWLAARYGLTALGFDAPNPDDEPEPDPDRMAALEPLLGDGSIATVFVETLSPTSWLEIVAEEYGLDAVVLNPLDGRTLGEDAADATYRSVMLYNLRVLKIELDCEET